MRDAAPACSLARALARKPRQRRKTRGEKHKERREEPEQSTRRHHEANVARASRASRLRVWWVACSPCSRAARARRAFGAGTFREFLERFCSELSGSIPGKAAKTCCAQRRKTRGEKHKERREEPEQSTRRHHEANGPTWREHREHEDCECGGWRAALARARRLLENASEILPKSLPEASREDHQEEQGESGEGRPRIETASAYYRL